MRYPIICAVLILCGAATVASAMAPTLTLTEVRRGTWEFTGSGDPPVDLTEPVGCPYAIPWVFEWQAAANSLGTSVTGFRYGWDITDPADDLQWEIDWTETYSAPPRTFYFGTHIFMIEARDNTGAITRGTINIHVEPVSVPSLRIVEGTRGKWFFVGVESPAVTLTDPVTDPVTPWVFEWDAASCADGIAGYRYGWDITDPGDDNQWSAWSDVLGTPPREFTAGVHNFMVEAKDNAGETTRGTIVFEVIQGPVPVRNATWGGIKALYGD